MEETIISKGVSNNLKIIAISFVVITHLINLIGIRYATPLGGIGVSIFLILSGYGQSESFKKNGLNNFFTKRLNRVVFPYLLACVISINLNVQIDFLEKILTFSLIKFTWFIEYIILCYAFFYCINKFINNIYLKHLGWVFFGGVIFFFGNPLWSEQAFSFYIGILFSDRKELFSKLKKYVFLILSVSVLVFIFKQIFYIKLDKNLFNLTNLIFKNGVAIVLIFNLIKINIKNKIFDWIGKNSYEIYLYHGVYFYQLKNELVISKFFIYFFMIFFTIKILKFLEELILKSKKTLKRLYL